jgi:hypothetical protein
MPNYYGTAMNGNTNGTPNTNTSSMSYLGLAGLRYYLQKLLAASYAVPADNSLWIRINRTSVLSTSGSAIVPNQMMPDGGAAACIVKTGVTLGTLVAVPTMQLAFNQRGTAMWAAFNADEAISGLGATASNAELAILSQCTAATVNLNVTGVHSE